MALFEIKMTEKEIVDGLRSNYGKEFTAADVRGFCAANDIAYQTVTKKIKQFSVGRGKWNLEVTTKAVENIEKSFSAPAVNLQLLKIWFQLQILHLLNLVHLMMSKTSLSLSSSILHSLLVSQVMVRHLV